MSPERIDAALAELRSRLLKRHAESGFGEDATTLAAADMTEITTVVQAADMLGHLDHAAWGADLADAVTAYRVAWFGSIAEDARTQGQA